MGRARSFFANAEPVPGPRFDFRTRSRAQREAAWQATLAAMGDREGLDLLRYFFDAGWGDDGPLG